MTIETAYEELLTRTGLKDSEVVCAYMYGSRVYGNARKNSDWDFIVVLGSRKQKEQFSDNLINVNFYSSEEHHDRLHAHEPSALECYFLPDEFKLKENVNFHFRIDVTSLRHAYSAKSSNSWVKAKKKLTVLESYNDSVGKKSLWHSIRLIEFAIQIATEGKIVDYSCSNHFYDEVMYCNDWSELFDKYKQKYNATLTEFRKVAPKE